MPQDLMVFRARSHDLLSDLISGTLSSPPNMPWLQFQIAPTSKLLIKRLLTSFTFFFSTRSGNLFTWLMVACSLHRGGSFYKPGGHSKSHVTVIEARAMRECKLNRQSDKTSIKCNSKTQEAMPSKTLKDIPAAPALRHVPFPSKTST